MFDYMIRDVSAVERKYACRLLTIYLVGHQPKAAEHDPRRRLQVVRR